MNYSTMSPFEAWAFIGRAYAMDDADGDRDAFVAGFEYRFANGASPEPDPKEIGLYPGNQNHRIAWGAGWDTAHGIHDGEPHFGACLRSRLEYAYNLLDAAQPDVKKAKWYLMAVILEEA